MDRSAKKQLKGANTLAYLAAASAKMENYVLNFDTKCYCYETCCSFTIEQELIRLKTVGRNKHSSLFCFSVGGKKKTSLTSKPEEFQSRQARRQSLPGPGEDLIKLFRRRNIHNNDTQYNDCQYNDNKL
jgi:hypothetical protein